MQRYFANDYKNNRFYLEKDDIYHIETVMRMKPQELVEIVYDKKLFYGKITSIKPTEIVLEKEIEYQEKLPSVTLVQSLVKEQKMDYILQKSTELGISKVIPLATVRSVVKITEKEEKKISRWERIVKEASEQSKRLSIPEIGKVLSVKELTKIDGYDLKILCTVNEKSKSLKEVLKKVEFSDKIIFIVGPEGGFTENEEEELINAGFISCSLGELVLRTETASTYIMSIINYIFMG